MSLKYVDKERQDEGGLDNVRNMRIYLEKKYHS